MQNKINNSLLNILKHMKRKATTQLQKGNIKRRRRTSAVTVIRPRVEKKGVDQALTTNPVPATTNTNGAIFVANLIAPGTGSFNRIGRKVHLTSLRVKGTVQHSSTADPTTGNFGSNILRMVVVWDKQPSGVLPAFDTIFGLTDQSGNEATTYLDPVKYDNMDRFQVLRDVKIPFVPTAQGGVGGTTNFFRALASFDEYIKLGRETVYSGQTSPATIADISSGGLYVVFRAQLNVPNVNFLEVTNDSYVRLRYTDK